MNGNNQEPGLVIHARNHKQCQSFKALGVLDADGSPAVARCTHKSQVVATEAARRDDGKRGVMALCGECLTILQQQHGPGFVYVQIIEPDTEYKP